MWVVWQKGCAKEHFGHVEASCVVFVELLVDIWWPVKTCMGTLVLEALDDASLASLRNALGFTSYVCPSDISDEMDVVRQHTPG